MNILVTGANGQLGNEIRIASVSSCHIFHFSDIAPATQESIAMLHKIGGKSIPVETEILDITDMDAIRSMVKKYKIDAVINCAAFTNVDAAESNFELAEKLNALAPENLATAMKETGGLLVHISTDYVFGKEPYNIPCFEDQKGTPTGIYGTTKLHGEERIMNTGCQYLIIRTAWLYSEFGKNFCRTMLNLTATKPELKVVFDQTGTPTYAKDLANAILISLDHYSPGKSGIYHYSNEGVCSWYDFTKMIQEYSEQNGCKVLPCHSDEFPSPVKRPAYSVLDKSKIKKTFSLEIPYWTDSLKKCLSNLLKMAVVVCLAAFSFSCSKQPEPEEPEDPSEYVVFHQPSYYSFSDFISEVAQGSGYDESELEPIISFLEEIQKIYGLQGARCIDYTYPSTDFDNKNIRLSARLYLPSEAFDGVPLKGVILCHHHILLKSEHAPTNICVVEGLPAWFGYAVIVPDNIGLGVTENLPQLFSNPNFLAKGAIESIPGAIALISDQGLECDFDSIYNIGYSFGASLAVSSLRYVSLHPDCGVSFKQTLAGAGMYDPSLSLREYAKDTYPDGELFVLPFLASILYEGSGSIKPEDVFLEPLLSQYEELILSKKYSLGNLASIFHDYSLRDLVTSGVIDRTSYTGRLIDHMGVLRRSYGGWTIPEDTEFYLYGVEDDNYVPHRNYIAAKYFFENTSPAENQYYESVKAGGHVSGFISFANWAMENIK